MERYEDIGGLATLHVQPPSPAAPQTARLDAPARLTRDSAIVVLFAAIVALSFGVSFATGNQHTYLLGALRELDPAFLSRDWLATETYLYHPTFGRVLGALGSIAPLDWSTAGLFLILIVLLLLVVWRLVRLLEPEAPLAPMLLVLMLVVVGRTANMADSFIFSSALEPSTLAGVALAGAMLSFVRGQWIAAGLLIALAGLFHINFLVLGVLAFGLAYALQRSGWRRERLWRFTGEGAVLLVPGVLLMLYNLPVLLAAADAPGAERATYIFQQIRSPHHYDPHRFLWEVVPFVGWVTAAAGALRLLILPAGMRERLGSLGGAFALLVVSATMVNTITFIPQLSQLFFWRLAPFTVLLCQCVVSVAVVRLVRGTALGTQSTGPIGWTAAGSLIVVVSGLVYLQRQGSSVPHLLLLSLAAALAVIVIARRWPLPSRAVLARAGRRPEALIGIALACATSLAVSTGFRTSNLLNPAVDADEHGLFTWARRTRPDALFLTPPDLETFRLHAGRAIVVDWKSTPILSEELLEWYRRISMVAGRDVQSFDDAIAGYGQIDEGRVERLRREFGIEYVVTRRGEPADRPLALPVVFSDDRYVVYAASDSVTLPATADPSRPGSARASPAPPSGDRSIPVARLPE